MEQKPLMPGTKSVDFALLNELMQEDGEDFVEAAYMALLKRRPDAIGGRIYQRALLSGTTKLQILYELSKSDECLRAGGEVRGLADACASEGLSDNRNVPTSIPPPDALHIKRAEQLLQINDDGKLIEVAYWVLLKRGPDSNGVANYLERLSSGTSKAQFLWELFHSPECRELGVELSGLYEVFAQEGLEVADDRLSVSPTHLTTPATTLDELLHCQGLVFVESAYLTLLNRAPDIQGYQHHLAQLLGGKSKIGILSEMVASAQVRNADIKLPGLAAMLGRYRLSRTPAVGGLFRFIFDLEGESVAECRGRATEQRLLTLETEFAERLNSFEKQISKILAIEKNTIVSREAVELQIAGLERSVATMRLLLEQYSGDVPMTSAHSPSAIANRAAGSLALGLRTDEIARDLRRVT